MKNKIIITALLLTISGVSYAEIISITEGVGGGIRCTYNDKKDYVCVEKASWTEAENAEYGRKKQLEREEEAQQSYNDMVKATAKFQDDVAKQRRK